MNRLRHSLPLLFPFSTVTCASPFRVSTAHAKDPYPGSPTHSSPLETQPHLWVCYRSYTIPTALVRNSCKINDACYRHAIMTNDGTFAKQKNCKQNQTKKSLGVVSHILHLRCFITSPKGCTFSSVDLEPSCGAAWNRPEIYRSR